VKQIPASEPSSHPDPYPQRLGAPARPQAEFVAMLRDRLRLDAESIVAEAATLIAAARRAAQRRPFDMQTFLKAFPITSALGVDLLRLAEALPRTGDFGNQVALLADKLRSHDRASGPATEAGVPQDAQEAKDAPAVRPRAAWMRAADLAIETAESTLPEPDVAATGRFTPGVLAGGVVRPMARATVQRLGRQFVFGEAIEQALALARERPPGVSYSFDMLGEGARSWVDADLNLGRYRAALEAVCATAGEGRWQDNDGVSIKLSAIHPRFETAQYPREKAQLFARLLELAQRAARSGVHLAIDAEESERLEMHFDLFVALARHESLHGWGGLGMVVQTYQLRALELVEAIARLAHERVAAGCAPLAVRLTKGAYWDREIQHAQELGVAGYPVFTDKGATDASYAACAQALFAHADVIFGQFATHNAVTVALVRGLAQQAGVSDEQYEFQRLHGMGEGLYDALLADGGATCRVYAPVGDHEQLLAYLIRRMLENGASTSFVRALADDAIAPGALAHDELRALQGAGARHAPPLVLPPDLYGAARRNAAGFDPQDGATIARFAAAAARPLSGLVDPALQSAAAREAGAAEVSAAVTAAQAAFANWSARPVAERAGLLRGWADALEGAVDDLVALCAREGGKTIPDGIAEVREAVDFCRYYAERAEATMGDGLRLPGPTGEDNTLRLRGRGVFACISPWNFPVAIFVGQVAAALAAGNTVVAKPAEQTPLAALFAVALAHRAGIPRDVLHALVGPGEVVGAALVADPRIAGVAFTGGLATAKAIQRALCAHPAIIPLVAETGGLNVMVVDSTALPEQVVDAVLQSAFRSAGQRCSALRVLALQDEIAEPMLARLRDAMATLIVGDPCDPATDVGPIIDAPAAAALRAHVERMRAAGHVIHELAVADAPVAGSGAATASHAAAPRIAVARFVAPTLIEIDALDQVGGEHFGPILHVLRFPIAGLESLIDAINATGFGLTFGVHTRIDARSRHVCNRVRAGNLYVNRNLIGAVVGTQPFGGEGLSGTGPKAGGPHYLLRFVTERTLTINTTAAGGNLELLAGGGPRT